MISMPVLPCVGLVPLRVPKKTAITGLAKRADLVSDDLGIGSAEYAEK